MARVVFSMTPGKVMPLEEVVRAPVSLPDDGHCLNCGDPKTVLELDGSGVCFDPCRYSRYLRKDGR